MSTLAVFIGNTTLKYVNDTRGFSRSWYSSSLLNIAIALCVERHSPTDLDRCVPLTSTDAARNATTGVCLVLADPGNCFERHMCERRMSCKWPPLKESMAVRTPYFADAQAQAAVAWVQTSYPKTLYMYSVPSVFLATTLIMATWVFCIMRFGCNRCWGRMPSRRGYTRVERWGPIVAVGLGSTFLLACAVIAIAESRTFGDGVGHTATAINATIEQLRALDALPVQLLNNSLLAAASVTAGGNWTAVKEGFDKFSETFNAMGSFPLYACSQALGAAKMPTYAPCTACPASVCGAINASLESIVNATEEATSDVEMTMAQALRNEPLPTLLALSDELHAVRSAVTAYFDATSTTVAEGLVSAKDAGLTALYSTLSIGLVSTSLGAVGVTAGLRSRQSQLIHLLHGSWITGVLFAFFGLLLGSIYLVLAVIGSDVCVYLDLIEETPELYLPAGAATIAARCLGSGSQDVAFKSAANLASDVCILSGAAMRVNGTSATKAISAYATALHSYTLSTFNYSSTEADHRIADVVTATGKTTWTTETLLAPWEVYGSFSDPTTCAQMNAALPDRIPLCYMSKQCNGTATACYEAFEKAYSYKRVAIDVPIALSAMSAAYATGPVVAWTEYLTQVTANSVRRMTLFNESAALAHTISCAPAMRCGSFRSHVTALRAALCRDTLPFCTLCSVLLFLASIGQLAGVLATILLQKRLRGFDRSEVIKQKRRASVTNSSVVSPK
ncbi:hypothetical protein ACHHYP_03331 [Achlya hypogyna]|uniref:Transmembrane protein n=1 Tax=Achlya hypogyna TaxID=1202772 RepID=A0A1V9Z3X4_ACHHY|nr:hypothetical protein ACHHYP_03331 [Achlya hypogyna]